MSSGYQYVPALRADLDRLVSMVENASSLSMPVPGLDWTADQVATHVALAVRALTSAIQGDSSGYADMVATGSSARETLAATNAKVLDMIRFTDPSEAAEALRAAGTELLTAVESFDPDAACPTPWYGADASRTAATLAGVAHGEILMHGLDLARALRKPWKITDASAVGIAHATMSGMLPHLLTPAGRAFTGAFDISLRGGPRFTLTLGEADRPDCTISMAPSAAILVGYGRMPLWKALISGQIIAYGRKPWVALRFTKLFDRP